MPYFVQLVQFFCKRRILIETQNYLDLNEIAFALLILMRNTHSLRCLFGRGWHPCLQTLYEICVFFTVLHMNRSSDLIFWIVRKCH